MLNTATKPQASPKRPRAKAGLIAVASVLALLLLVLLAKWLRTLPALQDFLITYPGHSELPASAPTGLPAWLGWQHFLNAFFLVLIVRTGWQVRTTTRPKAYWTRNNKGLVKTKGKPTKISLELWLHLTLDMLWALNGLVFMALLFITGQWMRIAPTSWDVFPNALSTALQYASLNWPLENGWINYNALQLLAYFTVVFIAAPLAIISGARMSGAWPKGAVRVNKVYPIEVARAIHFPTMLFFVAFVIMHVVLVLTTGALRNLNHMFAGQDTDGWLGFWLFAASIVATVAAWFLARPLFLRPVASLSGSVTK